MFEDLIKTVKAQLYDRITSPLLGCFLISWFIWNYKFIFTLFSDMKIIEKFKYIDNVIYDGASDYFIHCLALPLITTMFFIFIYPYPAKFTYEFFRKRQVELKEIQQKLDNETPLTKEEAKKIRSDAIKMSIDFEQEIEKIREENLSLRKLLKERNEKNSNEILNREETEIQSRKKDSNDIKLETEHIDYKPFFSKDSNVSGNSRLLVTAPEHIKSSIENHISSDKLFNGHSFMVDIDKQYVLISLLSRNGKVKIFKYDYHVPENGKIGYESMRIINSFDEDFLKFTKNNEAIINE
ncbi:hypothetical protein [Pectobacterium brasiliense]|uniref:hypothetical protein n=1 Tax=Pectobacterium brasiliense TaxID=180957 RepID=UPI0004E773C2|nr:hypothetical protein [Pectobacterium brasiliense]KFF70876.1 hypothetical protein IW00_03370 [Pectobacterium brasiliense]